MGQQKLGGLAAATDGDLLVILELGGNDRMCGLKPEIISQSLTKLVETIKSVNAKPLIMEVIPDGIERDVATNCAARLIQCPPDMVATITGPIRRGVVPRFGPQYLQGDRIHPNSKAQPLILKEVLNV